MTGIDEASYRSALRWILALRLFVDDRLWFSYDSIFALPINSALLFPRREFHREDPKKIQRWISTKSALKFIEEKARAEETVETGA